jgi:multidrug efflux pump
VVAIPVSLIGAVFLMQVFGFTVNLLTLLAIVLAVGLVVDDAIVVVENVERHLREGSRRWTQRSRAHASWSARSSP